MGRHVKKILGKNQVAGFIIIKWAATNIHGQNVVAGMYIYKIKAGRFSKTNKMILLK